MKKPKREKDTGKIFDTRRAAFREAKRDHGVPVGKQPDEVVKPHTQIGDEYKLDKRNRRLYIFRFILSLFGLGNDKEDVFIREDKEAFYSDSGKQREHFNAGEDPEKLKKHYYYKRK